MATKKNMLTGAAKGRVEQIDTLKVVCCFLVICIHRAFPGTAGQYIVALARVAVPVFFMTTGFFYEGIIDRNRRARQIKKILKLLVSTNCLYFLWRLLLAYQYGNIRNFFLRSFTWKKLFEFVVLNESPFSGHLWYLGAILYVLTIVYIADKLNCRAILFALIPLLLAGDLIFGKYSLLILGREFRYIWVRNFLFVGIPYFSLGGLIKRFTNIIRPKKVWSGMLCVLFAVTTLCERYFLVSIGMNATRDHYISTTFLAVSVFLFTLSCNGSCKVIAAVGRKYSTWIYILHPIVIKILAIFVNNLGIKDKYLYVAPFIVFFVTLLFLICIDYLKRCVVRIYRNGDRE
jgi:surface polysaccharide O-acyltransferase-like enzyme